MNKRYVAGVLALLVVLDLGFTFWLNYRLPLDGDLAAIVLPADWYRPVLHDPFGWSVLTQHASYSATNRFFAHAELGLYWKAVPHLLQRVLSPISSLYAASALFATLVQAGLLAALVRYVQAAYGEARAGFWVLAALLAPLFQTASGFYEQMGITDRSITYTFFYGFALLLLLGLLWPFYQAVCRRQPLRLPWWRALLLLALMPVVALGSPIGSATFFVLLLGLGLHWAWTRGRHWRPGQPWPPLRGGGLSGQALGLLAVLLVLCLYSLYIGRANNENDHTHTLGQLYGLLLIGAAHYFGFQLGLPVLGCFILFNYLLVRKLPPSATQQRVLQALGWLALLMGAYVLLLPFGGYRPYRPYLLRNDTALPVVLGLVLAYGLSAYCLLTHLRGRARGVYLLAVGALSAFFLHADYAPSDAPTSDCERWAFDQLARAPEPEVELGNFCNVLAWGLVHEPSQSDVQAQMLHYWGVTPTKKLYFQK